jgi:hypothetical protein
VHWDRNAAAIQSSVAGELIVVDGSHVTRIPLGVDSLNSGTLAYVRRTGNVEVRLRARSQDNELHEAVAHFAGPAPEPVTVTRSVEEDGSVERMRAEVERLNGELTRMRSAVKPTVPAPAPASTSSVSVPARTIVPPVRTAVRTPAPAAQTMTAPPPSISIPQSSIPSAPVSPQVTTAAPPPVAAPAASVPAAAVTPTPLARGKAIWTGMLPRGAVLLVDGRRPSVGALTGRMPDKPSRMRIYPADLREAGILVYTQAEKERIEAPSAGNGWNLTTYRPDAKRARDITVLESPSQANNWQRIMVRSEQRPLSMLVLEWEEVR